MELTGGMRHGFQRKVRTLMLSQPIPVTAGVRPAGCELPATRRLVLATVLALASIAALPGTARGANCAPYVGPVSPSSGTSYSAVFYTRHYDANGWRDLKSAQLLFNRRVSSAGAAYFSYNQNSNRFYGYDGSRWRGGYAPRAAATIRTAFGTLYMRDTYAYGSRTRLTVRWHVRFDSPLHGLTLHTYVYAKDDHDRSSGWRTRGSWSVPESGGGTLPAIFPPDNPWNSDISTAQVHPNSSRFIASVGADTGLHADFGTVWNGAPNGIPYCTVRGDQPKVPISFYYPDESDPGPYPIPADAPIEGGPFSDADRHILVIDTDNKLLYEVYDAHPMPGGWDAGSGAIFDLTSNALRPDSWTSADAAGLPIFPGLVRYDEVAGGEIDHALRFTVSQTQRGYIHPATHFASDSDDPDLPPMGLRLRLRSDFDESPFPQPVQVILRALKKYGMFVADNGGDWYISGAPDMRWNDDDLHRIGEVKGSDFEVVDTGPILR